jgi:hypothetical protein
MPGPVNIRPPAAQPFNILAPNSRLRAGRPLLAHLINYANRAKVPLLSLLTDDKMENVRAGLTQQLACTSSRGPLTDMFVNGSRNTQRLAVTLSSRLTSYADFSFHLPRILDLLLRNPRVYGPTVIDALGKTHHSLHEATPAFLRILKSSKYCPQIQIQVFHLFQKSTDAIDVRWIPMLQKLVECGAHSLPGVALRRLHEIAQACEERANTDQSPANQFYGHYSIQLKIYFLKLQLRDHEQFTNDRRTLSKKEHGRWYRRRVALRVGGLGLLHPSKTFSEEATAAPLAGPGAEDSA